MRCQLKCPQQNYLSFYPEVNIIINYCYSHSVYEVDGHKHMILKFYIQGCRKRGTVYVEMREVNSLLCH